ncbi:hypothetical protein BYT27DRAFT_7191338 [Phlegmacium glaucopus]|nr:hypothetical protein BYT27DRAFT_7191338 [Phlegmacium glaucopus]
MFSFDTSHYLFSICTAPEFPKVLDFCCPWGCTSSPIPTQMLIPLDLSSRVSESPGFLLSLGMYILSHPHPNVDSFGSQLPSFRKSRIFCCPWGCTSSPIPTQILIPLDLSELRVSETTELFVVPGLLSYAPPIPTQI